MTTVADEKIAKVTRNLHHIQDMVLKGSLDPDDLVLVLGHLVGKGARADNLLEYARANCPKINWIDATQPKAKRVKKGVILIFDEVTFFKTRADLIVNPDLERYVGLQVRSTRPHTVLKSPRLLTQTESEATMFGLPGSDQYRRTLENACDLGQIGELIVAQEGGTPGVLLNNACANIFPVRGKNGLLSVVYVQRYSTGPDWYVHCGPFSPDSFWHDGSQVFSN